MRHVDPDGKVSDISAVEYALRVVKAFQDQHPGKRIRLNHDGTTTFVEATNEEKESFVEAMKDAFGEDQTKWPFESH